MEDMKEYRESERKKEKEKQTRKWRKMFANAVQNWKKKKVKHYKLTIISPKCSK
jgi:hypothetical protein